MGSLFSQPFSPKPRGHRCPDFLSPGFILSAGSGVHPHGCVCAPGTLFPVCC